MTDSIVRDTRSYPIQPLLAASAAVFRNDRVLIARRGAKPAKGLWSLPGGLVEAGETLAEAAAREVMEETGVAADMIGPADIAEVIRRDRDGRIARHYVIVAFAARWVAGEPRAGEATDAVRWVRPEELDKLEMTEGTAEIIGKAALLAGKAT
jgi:8-oxo-dGTP diphosphatase